jgi:hypothetical protein
MRPMLIFCLGALIILIALSSGCVTDDDDDGYEPPFMSTGRIDSETNEFIFTGSGEVRWDKYIVNVLEFNDTITLKTEDGRISKKGDEVVFTDPLGNWDPVIGEEYNIRVVDKSDNKIVWEGNIVARSY